MSDTPEARGIYILMLSVHGLIRGHNLELGRDSDTGGQTKYVVELARSLAQQPKVGRVDLLTRLVSDPKVSTDYAQPHEDLGEGASLVRIVCGPRRYLRKEVLWHHLDAFVDNTVRYLARAGRTPDLIHSHYADAGYVGARLAQQLGVPLIHTGHSLGRVKRERLIEHGVRESTIESQYNIAQRIEAEEIALGNAALVIASTRQEVDEQYSQYENYHPKRMRVIPPGVDLQRFRPPQRNERIGPIAQEIARFLRDPDKPMILAVSRPDERKNIATLVRAFGEHPDLRSVANLVVVAGNRDDIANMEKGPRGVLSELLVLIDRYDLYGSIAYPKQHESNDVPELYRLAAKSGGIFINPALTEPFGLTLIEAAASGLPIVATRDGGPIDIVEHCENGVLIDPLDADAMGQALFDALSDSARRKRWARNGTRGARQHYSWQAHATSYLKAVARLAEHRPSRLGRLKKSRLPSVDRIVVCDVDDTLLGNREALTALLERLRAADAHVGLAVATGRGLDSTLKVLKEWGVPRPDVLITSVGSEIFYGTAMTADPGWTTHLGYRWRPEEIRDAMADIPGLRPQPKSEQRAYKISYFADPDDMPSPREIQRHLRRLDLHAKVIYSHQAYLDLLPVRASKGLAVRYLSIKWDIEPERWLVAGDSGNDEEMLTGNTLGVVVGNHSEELDKLRGRPRIYFAEGSHAWGIIEGIEHYDFLGRIRISDDEDAST